MLETRTINFLNEIKEVWINLLNFTFKSSISSLVGQNLMRFSTWSTSNTDSSKASTAAWRFPFQHVRKDNIFQTITGGDFRSYKFVEEMMLQKIVTGNYSYQWPLFSINNPLIKNTLRKTLNANKNNNFHCNASCKRIYLLIVKCFNLNHPFSIIIKIAHIKVSAYHHIREWHFNLSEHDFSIISPP